jgi:hypothetical protein
LSNTFSLKNFSLFFFFLIILSVCVFTFHYLYTQLHPHIINEKGELNIFQVTNEFGPYIKSIIEDPTPKLRLFSVDLYSARRPVLPYYILFVWTYFTKNFLIVILIKNLIFGIILFFSIKNYKDNIFFISICLFLIFYNPHNIFTTIDFGQEEGYLNYLIIILFFSLISEFKFKPFMAGILLSIIFFTKGSMFILTFFVGLFYIFFENRYKYIPLIFIIISNLIWGAYNYKLNENFAFGPKGSAFNTLNLANVYQKNFIKTYPQIRPDINYPEIEAYLKEKNINNEKELNDILMKKSLSFIINNPKDVIIGLVKKAYVVTLSPFKDAQFPDDNGNVSNPIRYSNFPNKIIFNLSIYILIISLFRKKFTSINKIDLYYLVIILTYLFPYMVAFVYPKHCTSLYILSHLYVFLYLLKTKNLKIIKKIQSFIR